MKNPSKTTRLSQQGKTRSSIRKKHRRHTRVHLDSLRPPTPVLQMETLSNCPKCQGLIYVDGGTMLSEKVIRCLNCGWQPSHRSSPMEEPEEARTMRALTVQIVSCSNVYGNCYNLPVNF